MATSFTLPLVESACPAAPVPRPPQPMSAILIVSSLAAAWALRANPNEAASVPPATAMPEVVKNSRREG